MKQQIKIIINKNDSDEEVMNKILNNNYIREDIIKLANGRKNIWTEKEKILVSN